MEQKGTSHLSYFENCFSKLSSQSAFLFPTHSMGKWNELVLTSHFKKYFPSHLCCFDENFLSPFQLFIIAS